MWHFLVALAGACWWLRTWRRSGRHWLEYLALSITIAFTRLCHGLSCNRPVPLPKRGPALVVCNHTCSADPMFLMACSPRRMSFLLAAEYMGLRAFQILFAYLQCVPVRRTGKDVRAARTSLKRLREGLVVCIFPEGNVSNAGRGKPMPVKSGAAWLALRSRVPVCPAFISDGPQTTDLLASWLLPSRVRVIFGPPIDLSAYYDRPIRRPLIEEVSSVIMKHVAQLQPRLKGANHERSNR